MEKWMIKNIKGNIKAMADALKISETAANILMNRGITTLSEGRSFLEPKFDYLHEPRLMKDMEKAVGIMEEAINQGRKIMIVGDYDVDGVISTFILYSAVRECGGDVCYEIPHRVNDGYGINCSIIERAAEAEVGLIITCDNGISAFEALQCAADKGILVIVTDHHDIPEDIEMLKASAIVNPKQKDCEYPFKSLCGAGVAYKFAKVLYEEMGVDKGSLEKYIHAAAIATVCDVVDLTGENRIITKNSLKELSATNNPGLKSLIRVTGLQGREITAYTLGFVIGPCINASGRLDCAKKGVELLLAEDEKIAEALALELFQLNKERKEMTLIGVEQAVNQIEEEAMTDHSILVVFNQKIHESIAGIVAGRLKERYSRPVIFLTTGKHGVKGSGRSIEGYNMFEELNKCRYLLGRFGGHPMAAGMSLEEDKVQMLRQELNKNSNLSKEDLVPKVSIDLQLPFRSIDIKLAEELELLEPFGKGNPKPVFAEKNIKIDRASVIGTNKNVLRLSLSQGRNRLTGVYFGDIESFRNRVEERYGELEANRLFSGDKNKVSLDLAFNVDINDYMGNRNVQLIITNFR